MGTQPRPRRRLLTGRRILFVPFLGVAGVLVMASVAWACVTFQGKFQVKGANGTSTAFGSGYHPYQNDRPSVEYCRPLRGAAGASSSSNAIEIVWGSYEGCNWTDPNFPATPTAAWSRTDGGPVDEGTYAVRFDPRRSFCDRRDPDCDDGGAPTEGGWHSSSGWFRLQPADPQCYWSDPGAPVVELGRMTVDDSGFGKASFEIPRTALDEAAEGPTDAAGVCTRELGETAAERGHPGPPHSNMAPVIVF